MKRKENRRKRYKACDDLVPATGIEPVLCCQNGILSKKMLREHNPFFLKLPEHDAHENPRKINRSHPLSAEKSCAVSVSLISKKTEKSRKIGGQSAVTGTFDRQKTSILITYTIPYSVSAVNKKRKVGIKYGNDHYKRPA